MLEVNVNCGFGYDINCVCENGVVNLPNANEVATKIEDNWILRFIDSYDVGRPRTQGRDRRLLCMGRLRCFHHR